MHPGPDKKESVISGPSKIATCCYCGTRAALVLTGKERHELSCSSCGAPLHDLKMLPKWKAAPAKTVRSAVSHAPPRKTKRKKKKKSMFSRVFDEAWDVIEDIFD
jgi:nitrate/TMAO reductase-like tetraheme cytochrome c subunit